MLKIAVIGVGYLGRFHAQKYAAMRNVDLVAVVDSNMEQAQKVAAECHCLAFADYQQVLPLVDAVSVVVPTPLHYAVSQNCLRAGLDVLVEKPITTTIAQADELIRLAEENKRILQVGHIERYNPATTAMWPMINKPFFISAQRLAPFKHRGAEVDVVLDLMIHDLDIILALINAPLLSLHSTGAPMLTANNDMASVRLLFEGNRSAEITASRVSPETVRKMHVFQPGACISLDFGAREVVNSDLTSSHNTADGLPAICKISCQEGDALELELCDFISHVRQRSCPPVDGKAGRRALELALQVIAAMQGKAS